MYRFIRKRLNKIYKLAVSIEDVCSGVGSLSKTKDAVGEIKKISGQALKGK